MQIIKKHFWLAFFLLFLCPLSVFAQTGSVRGKVTYGTDSKPLHQVSIEIAQLKLSAETDDDGNYEITNIPPGRYTVLAHLEGFSDVAKTVTVTNGGNITLDFQLQITGLRENVTVTATGTQQSTFESFQSVNSIGSTRITERASTSIGEVLEREAGVSKRSFGPGSSRPVIRGFDGDRVLILQDGVRTGSLGSQSGDHGEPIDPLSLERLEVVKGPATLLYGSNAIGGVVNAITNDDDDSHEGVRGYFSGLGSTANRQGAVSGGVEYGYQNWLFSGRGSVQREGDFQTPIGRIPNSASRSFFGTGSIGYYGQKGFANFSLSSEKRRYGVPFAALFEEERPLFGGTLPEPPDEEIDLRMRQNNYRFRGGFRNSQSFVNRITLSFNYTDYKHEEIENEEIGTTFNNDTFSYRAVFDQKATGKLTGRFGFEGYNRDYLILGDEALIEGKVKANNYALFALEELNYGRVSFQFGGRVENNRYRPENPDLRDRSFTGFSGAVGMRLGLWENGAFVVNYTNSYRAPAIEELYNNGPHIGTVTFEIGNENLRRERSNGLDFSVRHLSDRVRMDFDFYYYRISDFVFLAPVEEGTKTRQFVGGGLPVAEYLQQNSTFIGGEFNLEARLNKYVNFLAAADVVRAELNDNIPLPRIPQNRVRLGLDLHYKGFNLRPEAIFVADKERSDIFPTETPTAGYGLFNLSGAYTIGSQHYAHSFSFGAYNLTDKLYRNHLSYIKELVPEIGRGIRFSYTFRFF